MDHDKAKATRVDTLQPKHFEAIGRALTSCTYLEHTIRAIHATQLMREDSRTSPKDDDQKYFDDAFEKGLAWLIRKGLEEFSLREDDLRAIKSVLFDKEDTRECHFVIWRNTICHAPASLTETGLITFTFHDSRSFSGKLPLGPWTKICSISELHALSAHYFRTAAILSNTFL